VSAAVPGSDRFLDALTPAQRSDLLDRGRRRRYPAGTVLFGEGDRSDRCFVVEEGTVKIARLTEEGREVIYAVRRPGEIIGELAVLDGGPRSASATALEDVSTVQLDSGQFLSFLETNPSAMLVLVRMVAARLRDADIKLSEFAAADAAGRLARRLVQLSQEHGVDDADGRVITLPLSQDELAGWTGASREAVAKALAQFRQRGWVTTARRRITVHDIEALRRRGTP
jgi:CRP/FNR family transcriptional regulator, cyclic AMP receptor protein